MGDEAAFSAELARLLREPPRLARMRLAAQQYSASLQHTLKQQPSVSAAVDDFEAHLRTAMCRRAPAAGRPLVAGGRLTGRLALLLWLYGLQGGTFGLVGGALPVLVSGAPLAALGLLSLSLLPFALKVRPLTSPRTPSRPLAFPCLPSQPLATSVQVALAPLIDAYWSPRLGRRRSWVLPCNVACAALFALVAPRIDAWAAAQSIGWLGAAFTPIVFLLSVQDVAVDAWALELLPPDRLSYAAACQTIGMSAGNALGHPLLLAVAGGATLGRFAAGMALALLAGAAGCLLVPEPAQPAAAVAERGRASLRRQLGTLRSLLDSDATRALTVVCTWQRVGVVALDACAAVTYMRQPGARREHLAAFAAVQAPIGVLASVLAARLLARQGGGGARGGAQGGDHISTAEVMRRALVALLCCGAAAPLVLHPDALATWRGVAALLLLATVYAAGNKVWWTAQATAFNSVVALQGGVATSALHLQLLNSLSNLGKLWPRPLAFVLYDGLGFPGACAVLLGMSALSWPALRRALASPSLASPKAAHTD